MADTGKLYSEIKNGLIDDLTEALHNMRALATPHFTDASQTLALQQADKALTNAREDQKGRKSC